MPEEHLAALLAKMKVDAALCEQLRTASDLDEVIEIARLAGLSVSKSDFSRNQAKQILDLDDQALEEIAGGESPGDQCHCSGGNGYAMNLRIPPVLR